MTFDIVTTESSIDDKREPRGKPRFVEQDRYLNTSVRNGMVASEITTFLLLNCATKLMHLFDEWYIVSTDLGLHEDMAR
nr:hypothetical protein CFP56_22564 [Quercus suber]